MVYVYLHLGDFEGRFLPPSFGVILRADFYLQALVRRLQAGTVPQLQIGLKAPLATDITSMNPSCRTYKLS